MFFWVLLFEVSELGESVIVGVEKKRTRNEISHISIFVSFKLNGFYSSFYNIS